MSNAGLATYTFTTRMLGINLLPKPRGAEAQCLQVTVCTSYMTYIYTGVPP